MRRASALLLALAVGVTTLGLATPATAEPLPAPAVGQCTKDPTLAGWVLGGPVVDCRRPHYGQTILVGTWTSETMPSVAARLKPGSVKSDALFADLNHQLNACNAAALDLVGVSRTGYTVPTSFKTNVTGPNNAQWAAGQRWLRCDLVVERLMSLGGKAHLGAMPPPRKVPNIMRTPIKSNPYAVCGWMLKTQWGVISCPAKSATFLLPAVYRGADIAWPGNPHAFEAKMIALCRANRTVRSVTHELRRITSWATGDGMITKDNYKSRSYYCAVKR